ncbi:MAG: MFS transporter [Alphaproteobacteria bacterium]|nr:MFS transporter [Alphaproteobacteria bacterium]
MTERPAAGGVIALTLSHQIAVSLAAATLPVLLPALSHEADLGGDTAGLYAFATYAGAVAATFFCQGFFAAVGIARASLLCVLTSAAFLLLLLPGTLPAILVAGAAIGACYGPVTPASSSMILPFVSPGRANFLFSLRQTGAPLGVLFAGVLVPPLVLWLGWTDAVSAIAGLVAATALAGWRFAGRLDRLLDRPKVDLRRTPRAVVAALGNRRLRRLVTVSCLFASMLSTINIYIPYSVSVLAGATLTEAGWAAATAQVGAVGGRLLWGALADRTGSPRIVLALLGLAMAAAVAVFAAIAPEWPMYARLLAALALGATGAGWGGVTLAEVTRVVPRAEVGNATTAMMIFNYLGVFIGPPLVALALVATGSLRIALLTLTAGALAGAALARFGLASPATTADR